MSASPSLDDLLACALSAARAAGTHAAENVERRHEQVSTTTHDVKLQLDVECQEKAEAAIRSTFPDHAFLGEEDTDPARRRGTNQELSSYEWIVDPIDGTVNFSHGLQHWCCSVAVRKAGEILVGVVHAPLLDRTFSASTERASHCNDQPICVSATPTLSKAMIATGVDRNVTNSDRTPLEQFTRLSLNTQKVRVMGSAALDLCLVASGEMDGYFESSIYIWDVAAAMLIVRQAGGRADICGGVDPDYRLDFIASNGLIHDALNDLIVS